MPSASLCLIAQVAHTPFASRAPAHTHMHACMLTAVLLLQTQLVVRLEATAAATELDGEPIARRNARKRQAVDRFDPAPKQRANMHTAVTRGGCRKSNSRRDKSVRLPDQPRPVQRCRFCAVHGKDVVFTQAHRASCPYYASCPCFACRKVHIRNIAGIQCRRRRLAAEAALNAAAEL